MAAPTMGISSAGIESNPCAYRGGGSGRLEQLFSGFRLGGKAPLHSHLFLMADLAIEFAASGESRAGGRLKSPDLLDYRRLCSQ
jgi:hypothetical protein